jgi:hypothetical protein
LALGPRTKLLVSHFTADGSVLDPLDALTDADLAELASPAPAGWPIVRAISGRMLARPNTVLLGALAGAGVESVLDIPQAAGRPGDEYVTALLAEPARYPAAWVVAAERWRSLQHEETPLEQVALDEKWLPRVPRL